MDAAKKAAAAATPATTPAATPAAATPAATPDVVPLSIAQIKTRSNSQAIVRETIKHDTMLAAMGLLALHDMHDTPCADYVFQNRNNYTCNIL